MLEAIKECRWTLRDVRKAHVHGIVPHHDNDLVVGLAAVGQVQPADRQHGQEDVAVGMLFSVHIAMSRGSPSPTNVLRQARLEKMPATWFPE